MEKFLRRAAETVAYVVGGVCWMCSGLAFLRLLWPDDPSERVPALAWTTALFVGGAVLLRTGWMMTPQGRRGAADRSRRRRRRGAFEPVNEWPDEPYLRIPDGRWRQVAREEDHSEALAPVVQRGWRNPVVAALRSAVDVRPRSRARIVGVEVDGRRIGVLSDIQSRNMLPLVQAVEASGRLAVVRAEVDGTADGARVVVSCQTADEVPTGWWATNGVEVPRGGAGAASVDVDADADREGRPRSDDTARFAPPFTSEADPRGE